MVLNTVQIPYSLCQSNEPTEPLILSSLVNENWHIWLGRQSGYRSCHVQYCRCLFRTNKTVCATAEHFWDEYHEKAPHHTTYL